MALDLKTAGPLGLSILMIPQAQLATADEAIECVALPFGGMRNARLRA